MFFRLLFLIFFITLEGCSPTIKNHGVVIRENELKKIKIGDKMDSVRKKLGSPTFSTPSSFSFGVNGEKIENKISWYYINNLIEKKAMKSDKCVFNKVNIIHFNSGLVSKTETISGLNKIKINKNKTKIDHKKINVFTEIFGNAKVSPF